MSLSGLFELLALEHVVGEVALIRLSAPSPIPLRETGEGYNDCRLRPFAAWQMGEGADRQMRALSSKDGT